MKTITRLLGVFCLLGFVLVTSGSPRAQTAADAGLINRLSSQSANRTADGVIQLRGNVEIVMSGMRITADEVDVRDKDIDLRGNVHIRILDK